MLDPIPDLEFFEDMHRYKYLNEWLPYSVTQVLSHDMPEDVRQKIADTKDGPDGWQIRGNTVHNALEAFLTGRPVIYGDFEEWITPLMSSWLFKESEVLAVEYRMCDRIKRIGGSTDFILKTTKGATVLGDLKTVGSPPAVDRRKPADEQLGAYTTMLSGFPGMPYIDKCVTVVAGPGKTRIMTSDPGECAAKWLEAWGKFEAAEVQF